MSDKPNPGAEPTRDAPEKGQTLPSRHSEPKHRLPHERDESSDSHPGTADERVVQAARDVADGQQDTGRSPVVTELGKKAFAPAPEVEPKEAKETPGRESDSAKPSGPR